MYKLTWMIIFSDKVRTVEGSEDSIAFLFGTMIGMRQNYQYFSMTAPDGTVHLEYKDGKVSSSP